MRRFSFLLPESLASARLNVKLLKSKTVEPATDAAGQPIPGWVRFRLELQDYVIHNNRMHAGQIVDRFPTVREIANVIPVDFRNVPSTEIYFAEWHELVMLCAELAAEHPTSPAS